MSLSENSAPALSYQVTGENLYFRHSFGQTGFEIRGSDVRQYNIVTGHFSPTVAREARQSQRVREVTAHFLRTLVEELKRAAGFPGSGQSDAVSTGQKKGSWWRCRVGDAGVNDKPIIWGAPGTLYDDIQSVDVYRTKNFKEAPFATLRASSKHASWLQAALPRIEQEMRREEIQHRIDRKAGICVLVL